ncbi:MAG TPA: organic hydroperoxide resistance protein [Mycobacteriales bacterium]|jgi:osmotically inducible protein OsmC|nr:organic hydroperoxide resistance protein [Mycobacteriales bacterium]
MSELKQVLYTARATADGGRQGRSVSDDGRLDVTLSSPASMGGDDGPGTNPEQLFAAGYAACFHSALKLVAQRAKADAEGSTVTAAVGIGPLADGVGYGLTVELTAALPGVSDRDAALKLVETAHQVCPYSNAVRGNVDVALSLA